MRLDSLSDAELIARLTHVRREAHKCVFDFFWLRCPGCERRVKIDHAQLMGRDLVRCSCGLAERYQFDALLKRWAGALVKETDEIDETQH